MCQKQNGELISRTNKSERAVRCGDIIQLLGPIGVDEVYVLLDSHVVEGAHKEVIVMDIDHRTL